MFSLNTQLVQGNCLFPRPDEVFWEETVRGIQEFWGSDSDLRHLEASGGWTISLVSSIGCCPKAKWWCLHCHWPVKAQQASLTPCPFFSNAIYSQCAVKVLCNCGCSLWLLVTTPAWRRSIPDYIYHSLRMFQELSWPHGFHCNRRCLLCPRWQGTSGSNKLHQGCEHSPTWLGLPLMPSICKWSPDKVSSTRDNT